MEPRRKTTRLIDGEMKGIMDHYILSGAFSGNTEKKMIFYIFKIFDEPLGKSSTER